MSHIDYSLHQRLKNAVETLSIGKGDVRSRLKECYGSIMPLMIHDFPHHLQDDRNFVKKNITKYKSEHEREGNLDATMRKIKRKTGQKIAKKIHDIFRKIHYSYFEN